MDKTLESIRIQETKQSKDDDIQIVYKDDIIYRQVFRKQCTEPIEQPVLPKPCRQKVLKVSHNIPLACGMWYVDSNPRTWDQLLPYLLFAYREVPQESINRILAI